MDKANVSTRKYFNKQTLSGISSHIAAKKLIFRHPNLRLNFSVKRMFELLAYNGAFGTTPYSGAGLEMYFYVITERNMSRHVEIFLISAA
jgi:hypothetical protein